MNTKFNVLFLGIMPWKFEDLSDTVRAMVQSDPSSQFIYINPQADHRGFDLKWKEYEESLTHIWDPPLSFLPTRYKIHRIREKLTSISLAKYVERQLGSNWRDNTIVYVTPTNLELSYEYVQSLKPAYLIFDILDDNLNFPTITPERRESLEKMFIDIAHQATVITAVSEYLINQAKELTGREDIHYLPNGVDVDLFRTDRGETPEDISNIPHPRVTFVGAITSWIDMEIIEYIAEKANNIQLVLIGPIDIDSIDRNKLEKLKAMKNVHFLGGKPYKSIPSYLHASDVLLLPRTMDPYSLACDPLKLYEYLATGKPVVSTEHPSIKRFSNFVYSGKSGDEIVAGIQKALTRSEEMTSQQQAIVDSLSWETRLNNLTSLTKKDQREVWRQK